MKQIKASYQVLENQSKIGKITRRINALQAEIDSLQDERADLYKQNAGLKAIKELSINDN